MKAFLFICVAVTLSTMVQVFCMAIVGWLMGARIEIVSIFFGPKLLSTKISGIDFRVSLWPGGGYVKFYDETAGSGANLGGECFSNLHPLKRIFISASGPLALIGFAAGLIGPSHALQSLVLGLTEFFGGAMMPLSQGQYLVNRLSEIASVGLGTLLLGVIAVKMAAVNLLPIPIMNGGYIILEVARLFIKIPDRISERLSIIGFVVTVAFLCGWMIAISYYLIH